MSKQSEFVKFVFKEPSEGITHYTHRTSSREIAEDILKHGLYFNDSFQKTTDIILNDNIHIKYWQNLRKEYGDYTVIIGISTTLMQTYQRLLNKLAKKNYEVQQILTELDPFNDSESDEIYTVPVQYIKGFWDGKENQSYLNEKYDPNFDSPKFKRNIDNLLSKEGK